jgi:ParB family transcriptional regulator, chromosome partitioning protein
MRHDSHFVEQLVRPGGLPVGRMIPIEDIEPNPRQPRQNLGDLAELVASVREKGVLEPILVRSMAGRFQILAGERRFRAAQQAGLEEVPCVVREVTDAEAMEIALIENLQRKDLDAFEEADGLGALVESFGYTHEQLAERLGKSRTSITETLALSTMPGDVRELCRLADISAKSLLLQIVRQKDAREMTALIARVQQSGGTRAAARELTKEARRTERTRARPYVFRFRPQERVFSLALQFRKSDVSKAEIIEALRRVLEELSNEATESPDADPQNHEA